MPLPMTPTPLLEAEFSSEVEDPVELLPPRLPLREEPEWRLSMEGVGEEAEPLELLPMTEPKWSTPVVAPVEEVVTEFMSF